MGENLRTLIDHHSSDNSIVVDTGVKPHQLAFLWYRFPCAQSGALIMESFALCTISSSASFISSGNSSILAFLLSLLRMLCSTLLTLACTRTKRIQLEYRFGSSLHAPVCVFLFRCSFFLKVTRHKGCTGIRALFLISGILQGLSGTFILDHSLKSFVSQSRPFHHKEH